jgi:hypothetical protein
MTAPPDDTPPTPTPCDRSMTCDCQRCAKEKAERVARGVRPTRGNPLRPRPVSEVPGAPTGMRAAASEMLTLLDERPHKLLKREAERLEKGAARMEESLQRSGRLTS